MEAAGASGGAVGASGAAAAAGATGVAASGASGVAAAAGASGTAGLGAVLAGGAGVGCAAGSSGAAAAGVSVALGPPGADAGVGPAGVGPAGVALADGLLGVAGAAAFGAGGGKASRSLRSTGASMVEAADFTYSPFALSHTTASLLGIPNSLASVLTRTFDTSLLVLARAPWCLSGHGPLVACGHAHSSGLIECSYRFAPQPLSAVLS